MPQDRLSRSECEASALTPLRMGDVAFTFGGELPVRYTLHGITFDAERNIGPTEQTIGFIGQNLFRRCESLQIDGDPC
jgi:hypothetical protein